MKIRFATRLRRTVALLALSAATLVLAGSTGAASSPFVAVDLGNLGSGLWNEAVAVNDAGQVVGTSSTAAGYVHPFSWTEAGGMVDLGTLGGTRSWATALNGAGQAVGYGETASGPAHAFSWTKEAGLVDLGTLGGASSSAVAVNDAGGVVGASITASRKMHAFLWSEKGGMLDLGTLGGTYSYARAVNDAGQVVGQSDTADGVDHAFFWTKAGGMVDLGPGWAWDLNDKGLVVGGKPAFSWTKDGGRVDIPGLDDPDSEALDVAETGQIVGHFVNQYDVLSAFSWTPSSAVVEIGPLSDNVQVRVNDRGLVALELATPYISLQTQAAAWTKAGGLVTLSRSASHVSGVNNRGEIVGLVYTVVDDAWGTAATLWRDVLAPAAPSQPDLTAASDDGAADSDNTTGNTTLTFTGTAEPTSTVTLYRGATAVSTASAAFDGGVWTGTDTVPAAGTYAYAATATDGAGNASSASDALTVTVVATPKPAPAEPAEGSTPPAEATPVVPPTVATPTTVATPVTTPAIVRPVIARPTTVPARLVAGKNVAVSFKVTRSDNGARLMSGRLVCDPSVNGKVIKHAEQFKHGTATLRFTIPMTAKGKLLKVHVTIKYAGQSATRVGGFRVA